MADPNPFERRIYGYRLERELWPEEIADAIHDLDAVVRDETDWDAVQITIMRGGSVTIDVQLRKDNL